MKLSTLRMMTQDLSGDATVCISVEGVLFDLHILRCENHDAEHAPRIVFDVASGGYRYGARGAVGGDDAAARL